jgi:hypothetical protein
MAYVYKHIRLDTNEPFYIGIGVDDKGKYIRAHRRGRNKFWNRIVSKTDYIIEIIEDNLVWEEACEREKYWITYYGRRNLKKGTLCNLTDGGEGTYGMVLSESTKKKIGKANKGRKHTEETKQKISNINKGHTYNTPEVRKKISEKHKNNPGFKQRGLSKNNLERLAKMAENNKGKPTWNTGLTKETHEGLKKISNKIKGRVSTFKGHKHTDEAIQKIKNSKMGDKNWWKGRKHSEETKRKMKEAHLLRSNQLKIKEHLFW